MGSAMAITFGCRRYSHRPKLPGSAFAARTSTAAIGRMNTAPLIPVACNSPEGAFHPTILTRMSHVTLTLTGTLALALGVCLATNLTWLLFFPWL
jgi:hypothetical protein